MLNAGALGGLGAAEQARTAALADVSSGVFALPDELGRESSRAAVLRGAASEDQGVAAILDDRLGVGVAVGAGDLGDGLEAEAVTAAEFGQSRPAISGCSGSERFPCPN